MTADAAPAEHAARLGSRIGCWICREFVRALEKAVRALSLLSQRARRARMLLQDSWSMSRISAQLSETVPARWDW